MVAPSDGLPASSLQVLASLLAYVGGLVFVGVSTGIVFITFFTYFLLLKLQKKGEFDLPIFLILLFGVLGFLAVNISAENLLQEVRGAVAFVLLLLFLFLFVCLSL